MVLRLRSRVPVALAACALAVSAYGQEPSGPAPAPAPANLAFVDGVVDVVLDGVSETADPPLMLLEGDLVRTRRGRAEIVFGDGTLLHLAPNSELEVLAREHLRLTSGRLVLRLSYAAARPYVIDTPASSVRLDAEGEYGIAAREGERLDVSVTRGAATVTDDVQWTLRGGQMLTLVAGGRPLIQTFNSARWDDFTRWAFERTNGIAASRSAAQLPYELRPYSAVLDQYGRWDYVAPHGYVWFPSVSANWRPYYDGSWSFTRYGWTWYGRDRWSWPTHHYGRWDFTGAFWYWIPATAWAPAWVTWSIAPGYVSWAPLGWHSSRWRADHAAYAPHDARWRGWTVVPRDRFVVRRNLRAHVIEAERLDDTTRRTLIGRAGPVDNVAVPRGSVDAPGAQGNVRRSPSMTPPRDAYRRAPAATAPPAGTPGSGADGAAGPSDSAVPRSGRRSDHPAYAPPAAVDRERPGSIRTRRAGDAAPPPSGGARDRAPEAERPTGARSEPAGRPVRRIAPPADAPAPPSSPTPSSDGAVHRNGGARRGDAAQRPSGDAPPPSSAPARGGARRRPGA